MRLKQGFVLREVCGERVIMAEGIDTIDFSKLVCLNETAAVVWEKATALGEFTSEQLADGLCEEYDVEKERALADVENLLTTWKKSGLVQE